MFNKIRFIGYFFILGFLPKYFDVPQYFKYFLGLIIFIFIDDLYNYLNDKKNK